MTIQRTVSLLTLCLLLLGCVSRGEITLAPETAQTTNLQRLFIATNRNQLAGGSYGVGRSEILHFSRADISIPADRTAGTISWPKETPDPSQNFVTTEFVNFTAQNGFEQRLKQEIQSSPGARGEVYVFVHGFNTNFSEGLYRAAQSAADYGIVEPVVHFSWASAAQPLGYLRDRDSVLISRSAFVDLLKTVKRAGASKIIIMAHSMGTHLTMEAYRQVALSDPALKETLFSQVILLSADIDIDVFRAQLMDIGEINTPIVVFGTDQDKALALSSRLAGGTRLGNVPIENNLQGLNVIVIDVSEVIDGQAGNHLTMLSSQVAIDRFNTLNDTVDDISSENLRSLGPVAGGILSLQNFTKQIYEVSGG